MLHLYQMFEKWIVFEKRKTVVGITFKIYNNLNKIQKFKKY